MKQYTIGKKAAVIVLHQLCMILMVTGVFATGYAFRHDAHENIDIYTLISLAGLVGSFVSLAYMANVAGICRTVMHSVSLSMPSGVIMYS